MPQQVLIVDQSPDGSALGLIDQFDGLQITVKRNAGGIARALNLGIEEAAYDAVLVTHDDCTVAADWVGNACRRIEEERARLVTGRVLPPHDAALVPSTITDTVSHDYTGELRCDVLYPNNMAFDRRSLRAAGGFDERFSVAAEDNDLCYRWLAAGGRLLYDPDLVVWHHDWRSPRELEQLYVQYWHGQGQFYAKHLRARDYRVLAFIWRDLRAYPRSIAARILRKRPRSTDSRRGLVPGLVTGLAAGFREFKSP